MRQAAALRTGYRRGRRRLKRGARKQIGSRSRHGLELPGLDSQAKKQPAAAGSARRNRCNRPEYGSSPTGILGMCRLSGRRDRRSGGIVPGQGRVLGAPEKAVKQKDGV